jgi:hypothetical protein
MLKKTIYQRSCLLWSLFFLFAAQLFGQNTHITNSNAKHLNTKTDKSITFFLDFKTFNYRRNFNFGIDSQSVTSFNEIKTKGFYPSLALTHYKSNGHFTETALTFIQFQNIDDLSVSRFINNGNWLQIPTSGAKTLTMKMSLRFGYNFLLNASENNQFYLGISTEPVLSYSHIQPYSSAYFPDSKFEIFNIVSLMPRFIKNINKKLFFDVNLPISIFSTKFWYEAWQNPILPTYQQRKSVFEAAFIPRNFQLRMGVGMRI